MRPSTPVLRGSGGAVLRQDDAGDALTLSRGDEETRIPLRAIRRVSPGGRAVTVALRVPEGGEPVVHVVQGVNDTSAYVFASTVGAALDRLPEPPAQFDGAALVTTRSLATPRAPETASAGAWARGRAWVLLALGPGLAALIGVSVMVVVRGEPAALVLSVLVGIVTVVLNLCGAASMERAFQMWALPWRGVTVMAVRTSPYGKSGIYAYTGPNGESHTYSRQAYARSVEISYHPDDPGVAVGVYPVVVRVLVALGSLALWAATIGMISLMVVMGAGV